MTDVPHEMSVNVHWYETNRILVYRISGAPDIDDIESGLNKVYEMIDSKDMIVDVIFDYRTLSDFPHGTLKMVQSSALKFPTLNRIALVGHNNMIEMIMIDLANRTQRQKPTIHDTVDEAAARLRELYDADMLPE